MSESYSSSFIPKRGVTKKPISTRKSNFLVFSVISYALFVAAPLASAAIFIYERHTENQFNKAVVALDEAVVSFNQADYDRVWAFNERLIVSKELLNSHISINNALEAIESATAKTVAFKSIDIVRSNTQTLKVTGDLVTSNFDGALFQRATYEGEPKIVEPVFSKVFFVDGESDESQTTGKSVQFSADFSFLAQDIKFNPAATTPDAENKIDTASESSDTAAQTETISDSASDNNETNI
jgi:hypothetical protein